MTEILDRYKPLVEAFTERVEAVPAGKWGAESPCEGWTARDVVAHVIENHRRIAAGVQGEEPEPFGQDEDPVAAWREACDRVLALAGDEQALQQTVPTPMGPMPLAMLLGRIMATDVLVHTWDLARAAGLDERLDADAVHHAFEGLKPMDAMLRQGTSFGPKVEAPEGADEQTQLLCFLGRPA